jgi:hypothetical protein
MKREILGEEVKIFLSAVRAHGEVMPPADQAHEDPPDISGRFVASLDCTLGQSATRVDKDTQK